MCLGARFSAAQPSSHPALSLHLPGTQVQDYMSWAARVWQELQVEESSQEASSGPIKFSAHQQLRAELEIQEELNQRAAQLGQQALLAAGTPVKEVGPLCWCPPCSPPGPTVCWPRLRRFTQGLLPSHPCGSPQCRLPHACPQVQEGLRALQDRREQVFQAWQRKQERLQSMYQEQQFLRKCGRLEEILTAQEAGALTPVTHFPVRPLLPVSPLPASPPYFPGLWLFS